MRISVTIFVILISTCIVNASVLDPVIENVVHLKASTPPSGVAGIWKKKTIWKPRWVKEWKSAKVMKPVWKKVWSPVQIREWVPIPKPPPGWDSISTPLASVHPKSQKAPVKDSTGHDSFTVHTSTKIPLWDPIPYPESQQPPPPPPPPFSQPSPSTDSSCGKDECDNSHSAAFNHQQISEIIGPRYSAPEYFQNAEFSETVNHLTRLPPDGSSWRSPLPDTPVDNRFGAFPGLPEFLVPPMFQSLRDSNFGLQLNYNQRHHFNHVPNLQRQVGQSPALEAQTGLRQWPPLPPETKIKGHFVTNAPDQPYKFRFPEMELLAKNKTETTPKENFSSNDGLKNRPNPQSGSINGGFRPHTEGDIVQEAHLVGEYHYSEFDLRNIKQEPTKPQLNGEEKPEVKSQQKVKAVGPAVQKSKPNHRPLWDNKLGQNQTESKVEAHRPQSSQHVQKKHVSSSSSTSSNMNLNFQQQKAILKEIFPLYDIPLRLNNTLVPPNHRSAPPMTDNSNHQKHLPINHSSTILLAVEPESNLNSSNSNISGTHQKENHQAYGIPQIQTPTPPNQRFLQPSASNSLATNTSMQEQKQRPVYENPQMPTMVPYNHRFFLPSASSFNISGTNVNFLPKENYPQISTIIPPNHRFSPPSGADSQEKHPRPNHTTKLLPVAPTNMAKDEKLSFGKNVSVQLVFPTTPDDASEPSHKSSNYRHWTGDLQKTTTTEPYSVIFSSSLSSTTEAVTKSPVVVVTPLSQNKS